MSSGLPNNIEGDIYYNGVSKTVPFGNLGAKGSDIASASTTNLANATGGFVDITGTTTITAFGTVTAGVAFVLRFNGALTLTHNATSLIIPGAANITTASGDVAFVMSLGSGNWLVTNYFRAAALPVLTSNQITALTATSTNDNAASGKVGEFVSSVVAAASAVTATNATVDVTSISLTAGDWDVWGNTSNAFTATAIAASGWVSSSSATLPDQSLRSTLSFPGTIASGPTWGIVVPQLRFSLSGTTTIYLSGLNSSSSGTSAICGGIYARRVR